MKKYIELEIEVIRFSQEDVIRTSGEENTEEDIKNNNDDKQEDFFTLS